MKTHAIQEELTQTQQGLRELKIPPCPVLLQRLRAALDQPEPDMSEVQAVAAADVAMAATLLRVANSPLHLGDGAPCASIGQALTRLGLAPAAELMQRFLVRHALPVSHPQLARFWERSAQRAVAMRFLAAQLPGTDPELAASFGLFQHVGIPVLMQQMRGYGATLVEAAARIDRPFVATENANHRTNHAVVGALVARAWGLPGSLMAAVRLHHDFSVLGARGTEPEVETLVAAGLLSEHLVRQHERLQPDADWRAQGEQALAVLGFSAEELPDWSDALVPLLDEAI